MGIVNRRTLFEQPVINVHIFTYFWVFGALVVLSCVAVTSARDVTSRQQPPEGTGGTPQQHHSHHRPICPDGWVRGSTGGQSFKDKDAGLCLYLSPQSLTWSQARGACRARDGVLLSLDSVLSVEDRLFPQYLKDKGVGEVWTGMHKDGGRQIWDEPGKDMVRAYRGSQRALGEARRGWTWDASTFSDARLTCGVYTYSSDQPHPPTQHQRQRRDADTPSPAAVPKGSSDSPGREGPAHTDGKGFSGGGGMDAFKSFLSDQGMKSFADKMSDAPADKSPPPTQPLAKTKTAAPPGKKSSTHTPTHTTTTGKANKPPSGKSKDTPSSDSNNKKNDPPSDKSVSGAKDKDKNDHPSDDKSGTESKSGNSTADHASSDEEDNHELTKRSTPSGHGVVTTANPGDLLVLSNNNATNATQQTAGVTPPTTSTNLTADNTNTNTNVSGSASEDVSSSSSSSQKNDTSSAAGLFDQDAGFSKEILDFFNTDSKGAAAGVGVQPATDPKTDTASGSSPPQDNPPSPPLSGEKTPPRLSPQDFFHRFTKKVTGGGTGGSSSNDTQTPTQQAAAQPGSAQDATLFDQPHAAPTARDNAQQTGSHVASGSRTGNTSTTVAGGVPADQDPTPPMSAPRSGGTAMSWTDDVQPHGQLFGSVATQDGGGGTTTTTTTPPSTTQASSSEEEVTDSSQTSQEATTTTTSVPPSNDPGLFSDSAPGSSHSNTFQQHFGPSSSPSSSSNSSSSSSNSSSTSADGSPTTTAAGVQISDDLFRTKDVVTLPPEPYIAAPVTDSDSQEVTPSPSPDSQEVTPSSPPDSQEVTPSSPPPDSQEVTAPQNSREDLASSKEENPSQQTDTSKELTPSTTTTTTPSTPPTQSADSSSEEQTTPSGTTASTSRHGHGTTRMRESSEELNHVTSTSTTRTVSHVTSAREGTTLAHLLDSMTPRPDHVLPSAGHSWMTLQQCQQRHQFVCAAKPVHDFTMLTQCGDGWLGHSLVSRCYRLVSEPAPYPLAKRRCQNLGGALATADTAFFANVTHLLLDRMSLLHGFASKVWLDTGSGGQGGQCSAMEPQVTHLQTVACDLSLPFLCQKAAASRRAEADPTANNNNADDNDGDDDDNRVDVDRPSMMMNMSSWNTQPLVCPVRPLSRHDTVIWYKDGQPVPSDADDLTATTAFHSSNTRNPAVLQLNIHLLQRLGVTQRRMQQPALLQGMYWCRVWRHHPLRAVTSDPVYVRFQDVVTLQGFIQTNDITVPEATFFNEMHDTSGLPAAIGRGLQLMNDRIYPSMQRSQPFLSDVITVIQKANAETEEVEFRTYLCLTTGAMAPQDKGAVVDAYLQVLHTELVASEDLVRRDWNLSLPFEQAFRLLMTEMCPESRLVDKSTGNEAKFPSTPVNQHAVSLDSCDGMFTGYAVCRGDLKSGAYWAHWSVDMTCYDSDRTDTTNDRDDNIDKDGHKEGVKRPKVNPEDVVDTGHGIVVPSKPNPDLLDIDEVHIEQENVADVTDRLEDILDTSDELTDVDVEIVADVVDRVALVPVLPQDVGLTLLKTVNRVLDSSLQTLQKAQRKTQASTRILQDLDKFSEKLDLGHKGHVRYVTPNVAMEVWNTRDAREPVIGLAATLGATADSPLTETRIMTLSNRTWADLHLHDLDVAIELPDQLVSADGVGNGRLSMAIYRKPGLFLSSLASQESQEKEHVEVSELNSAIISATLASTTVSNLKDSVKLIFRPLKDAAGRPTRCVYWDFTMPPQGGWSSRGCLYNGTVQGRAICLCDHLTNFAVLLDFYGDSRPVDEANTTALSIITIIGLSLSILGLALTVITFIFFKKLRQGRAQQTLFHTAVALLCSEVVLLVGLKQTANYGVCLAVAVLLHYFILASFLWMLVEAVLQYLTFVKVLGTYISKYTLKTVLPAWTVPLIPVIAVLATDYRQYRGRRDYCWMNLDAFYYAFALPVGVIILFNIVTFIVIMLSLLRRPEGLRSTRNKGNTAETNIKAAFTIFILLGLTWTFGYLAIADARLPFQYMFTIFSSLQGFLIFVLLVARRRQFREQWRALCCGRAGQARGGQKITPTLSNSASSHSSTSSSSFTSSSRSRTSSGGSVKTLDVLIKRADSNASRGKAQLSAKGSNASSTKSRQC